MPPPPGRAATAGSIAARPGGEILRGALQRRPAGAAAATTVPRPSRSCTQAAIASPAGLTATSGERASSVPAEARCGGPHATATGDPAAAASPRAPAAAIRREGRIGRRYNGTGVSSAGKGTPGGRRRRGGTVRGTSPTRHRSAGGGPGRSHAPAGLLRRPRRGPRAEQGRGGRGPRHRAPPRGLPPRQARRAGLPRGRLPPRRGPGRPPKRYRLAESEVLMALPERHYDLLATLLLRASAAGGTGPPQEALERV